MNDPSFVVHLASQVTIPYASVSDAILGYLAVVSETANPGVDVVVVMQCGRQMFGFSHQDALVIAEQFGLPQPVGKYGSTVPLVDLAILESLWEAMLITIARQRGPHFLSLSTAVH